MSTQTKIFAKAALFYGDKVLLVRRSPSDSYMPGSPDLPGGEIDDGETIVDGLIRELAEEIGLQKPPESLRLVYTYTDMKVGQNFIRLYYVGELEDDNIVLSKEHDTGWWLSLEEAIEKNDHPTQNQFLRYIHQHGLAQTDGLTLK